MSEFLKLAYELISAIIYNIVSWVSAFFGGLVRLLFTAWPQYGAIVGSYFGELNILAKVLAILLILILIAIPAGLIYLIVRHIILRARLKHDNEDSVTLYKEIGRLNRQVLQLMDEKDKILTLKVGNMGGRAVPSLDGVSFQDEAIPSGTPAVGVNIGSDYATVLDSEGRPVPAAAGAAGTVPAGTVAGVAPAGDGVAVAGEGGTLVGGNISVTGGSVDENAISAAATAAATAAASAAEKSKKEAEAVAHRFPKLDLVDEKYEHYERPAFDDTVSLDQFAEGYRKFAASRMKLYYTPEIVRRFVSGMAASKLLILEGISGTGKTSLPYSFSRYLGNPATLVSVQPSYRDRTELLGYFNEFSKRFNETEFLRALYEANYREDPSFIVLDEMNLARIEYYFAEMLSVLEMPSIDEWTLDLVPTAWPGDPDKVIDGKIWVSPNTWFVGTANNDDSTFTITDKVYDRAMPIELNERADPFECEDTPPCIITCDHLRDLFSRAKEEHPISESTMTRMAKINQYLLTRFKLAFGNRIMKQLYDFIPVYVACGGTELGGLDYIMARKVLKKFETQNVQFVRDEMKGLLEYMEKTFGKTQMPDSMDYLRRIQNLY